MATPIVETAFGAGGSDVFLYFSREPACGLPIQLIDIAVGEGSQAPVEDLDKGAGGDFLYLLLARC